MRVVVIGHQDAVWGFALVGVRGFVASTEAELNQALDQVLSDREVGIVLVTEDIARMAEQRLTYLRAYSNTPVVLEIPGPGGPSAKGSSLAEIVLQTTGVRV
jgi:V/A-type H+-transporting ATPase subunit F